VTLQKPPTKAELRAELQAAVESYLEHGGEIHEVARGISGREDHRLLIKPLFDTPKTPRTNVSELIANIESRRHAKPRRSTRYIARKKPRQKILYDDFGEPIRKIWVDE